VNETFIDTMDVTEKQEREFPKPRLPHSGKILEMRMEISEESSACRASILSDEELAE